MIRRVQAVRFDSLTEGGRNRPLRAAVDVDGEEIDVFLKPSAWNGLGIEAMANEVLACLIGAHMALPVCEPYLVEITEEWVDTIDNPELRSALRQSCPVAFGSRSAGAGWRKWSVDDILAGSSKSTALGIFAFDAFTQNPDRLSGPNPNLLVRSDEFRIIDHELSFRIRMALFPRATPWVLGNLAHMCTGQGHALASRLKRARDIDYGRLRTPWVSLDDAALQEYAAQMPAEWSDASLYVQQATDHLAIVRDRIDDCMIEIERVLS